MIVRKTVGTGITKRERITSDGLDPTDREEHDRLIEALGGYIDPRSDFHAWLDRYEGWLARIADRQGLPNRGDAMVIYDGENRQHWRYATDRAECAAVPHSAAVSDRFKDPRCQLAMFYLTFEEGDGHRWGYQSVRWYFGELMFLASRCREALEAKAWLRLAGCCVELGRLDNEFKLKWPAERALRKAKRREEKTKAGQDKGNAIKTARKEAWQDVATRIWASSIEIQQAVKATEAKEAIEDKWPADVEAAPPAALYLFVRNHLRK